MEKSVKCSAMVPASKGFGFGGGFPGYRCPDTVMSVLEWIMSREIMIILEPEPCFFAISGSSTSGFGASSTQSSGGFSFGNTATPAGGNAPAFGCSSNVFGGAVNTTSSSLFGNASQAATAGSTTSAGGFAFGSLCLTIKC